MTSYFIHDGLNHSGPFSLYELKEKTIVADTPVWTEGLGDWSVAKEIPELASFFNLKPTPPPFQGARRQSVAVVPAFNVVQRERESPAVSAKSVNSLNGQDHPFTPAPEPHEQQPVESIPATGYEQELYQMEMENYFMENGRRSRNQLWIAAAVVILGSLTFWLVKLMSA